MQLTVKEVKGKGKGLFANRNFVEGQTILKFNGKFMTLNKIEELQEKNGVDSFLQVSPNLYIDLSGHSEYFVNHSCNPNCYVKVIANNAFLVASRLVVVGEELTFDYALTSTEDATSWVMPCNCKSYNCRKFISGFPTMSEVQQASAIAKNHVPKYVRKHGGGAL